MSTMIYLVRHGIAEDPSPHTPDEARALTPEGVEKMHLASLGLKRLGVAPDTILTSPLRRARETAAVIAEVLGLSVHDFPPLAPGENVRDLVDALPGEKGAASVLLVGHAPDMGEIVSYLLTGSEGLVGLPFKKGAVAAVRVDRLPPRHRGALEWFLTAKQLAFVAEAES